MRTAVIPVSYLLRVCTEIKQVAIQGDTAVIRLHVLPHIFTNWSFCYEVQAHSVKKKAAVRTYCIRTMYQVVVTYISIPGKYQATLPDPTINICTEIGIYFCLRRPLLLQGPRLTYEFGFIYWCLYQKQKDTHALISPLCLDFHYSGVVVSITPLRRGNL